MASTFKPKPWEEVKDLVAGKESYGYDTIAYDLPDGKNKAGIIAPKPISQMTIGELNDWQESEMRNKSRAYGLTLPNRQAELRRQGFQSDPGSTGVGRYQFEKSTLVDTAKDLYGDNYRNVTFDPDTQEKLASHLYYKAAARGPEALGNTWHALRGVEHTSPSTVSQNQIMVAASKPSTARPAISAAAPVVAAAALTGRLASALTGGTGGGSSEETDDIGTLGQYRGKYALFSNSARSKLRSALLAKAERQRQREEEKQRKMQKVAESTVKFKNFRKKICEQIIMNEERENKE